MILLPHGPQFQEGEEKTEIFDQNRETKSLVAVLLLLLLLLLLLQLLLLLLLLLLLPLLLLLLVLVLPFSLNVYNSELTIKSSFRSSEGRGAGGAMRRRQCKQVVGCEEVEEEEWEE